MYKRYQLISSKYLSFFSQINLVSMQSFIIIDFINIKPQYIFIIR